MSFLVVTNVGSNKLARHRARQVKALFKVLKDQCRQGNSLFIAYLFVLLQYYDYIII